MNKIFFLIPFFIIGCSTPEIHIPSYDFSSDSNTTEDANKPVEATSDVASIEGTEKAAEAEAIVESNTTDVIEVTDTEELNTETKEETVEPEEEAIEVVEEEEAKAKVAVPEPKASVDDILADDEDDFVSSPVTKKEKPKSTKNINKSSGFFSSLFKPKAKVKNEYYTGGKIRSKLVMSDNSGESGLLYKYGYEGQVTSTINLKNGIKNGLETLFNDKGRVMKRTPYVNGRKDGIVEVYYPDGKVLAQITYVNDKRHGRASKYNHDGTTNEEVEYNHGRVMTEQNDIDIPIID